MSVGGNINQKYCESESICFICRGSSLSEELLLPSCQHYYCKECVNENADIVKKKTLFCPSCHVEVPLEDVGGCLEIMTVRSSLEQSLKSLTVSCESCSDSEAKADNYCLECEKCACSKCIESHNRMKVFDEHSIVPMQDLGECLSSSNRLDYLKCPSHAEPFIAYCFRCQCLACNVCITNEHCDHKLEFCATAAPKVKTELESNIASLKTFEDGLKNALADQQIVLEEIESTGRHVAQRIKDLFDLQRQILETYKQDLLDQSKHRVGEMRERVNAYLNKCSQMHSEVSSVVSYTKCCIEHCSNNELVALNTRLMENMSEKLKVSQQSGFKIPEKPVLLGIENNSESIEKFEECCRNVARLKEVKIDPSKCSITGFEASEAEVGRHSEISLVIKLSDSRPTKCKAEVKSHLKCMLNDSVLSCEVSREETGQYSIEYTPIDRGLHTLSVFVNGKEILESPLPLFVLVSPKKFGEPVSIISQSLSLPTALAVNSSGEMVVIELEGGLVVLNKVGKEIKRLQLKKHGFQELSGVAVGAKDNIFFVDMVTSKIGKLDPTFNCIFKKKVSQVNGPGHCSVATAQDEVLVCECHNKGSVMVYNKDLDYIRRIFTNNLGLLLDLALDSHNNLYAVDNTNFCISVLDCQGQLLRTIGRDTSSPHQLRCPRNVRVIKCHIYVSDWEEAIVKVFDLDGKYVSSFGPGTRSSASGPQGLCIDCNGYVYLFDLFKSTIEKY